MQRFSWPWKEQASLPSKSMEGSERLGFPKAHSVEGYLLERMPGQYLPTDQAMMARLAGVEVSEAKLVLSRPQTNWRALPW